MIEGQKPTPILVSGAHRSGTTWIGKMLALEPRVGYISEPLNVRHRPGVMRASTEYWYNYICEDNQQDYLPALQEMLRFDYHLSLEIRSIHSVKDLLRMSRDWLVFRNGRKKNQIPLIKDPFAVFSSKWFAKILGCQVVVVVRHPAAVTSSLIKLGWTFDFQDLLKQPLLLRDWLEPYRNEMEKVVGQPNDLIAQSCLLWKMIYQTIAVMREQIPGMILIRHEDFANAPQERYKQLFEELNFEYTPIVEERIRIASSSKNPKGTSQGSVHSIHIDSQAVVKSWQKQLSKANIERIFDLTRDVADTYYSDADWQ